MIGDLPAAVGALDRYCGRAREMLGPPRDPDRVYGPVLEHPKLVGSRRVTLVGETAHGGISRGVVGEAEAPDDGSGAESRDSGVTLKLGCIGKLHYNTIVTIG